jgi:hypothetical protein
LQEPYRSWYFFLGGNGKAIQKETDSQPSFQAKLFAKLFAKLSALATALIC